MARGSYTNTIKRRYIDDIYKHIAKCYMPNSGVAEKLREGLMRLSENNLANLKLMIETSEGRK